MSDVKQNNGTKNMTVYQYADAVEEAKKYILKEMTSPLRCG